MMVCMKNLVVVGLVSSLILAQTMAEAREKRTVISTFQNLINGIQNALNKCVEENVNFTDASSCANSGIREVIQNVVREAFVPIVKFFQAIASSIPQVIGLPSISALPNNVLLPNITNIVG